MKSILLLLSSLFLFTGINLPNPEVKTKKQYVHYTKVGYQANTKMIKYFYQSGKQKRVLMFELEKQLASITISDGKKTLAIITGNGKKVTWQKYGSKKQLLLKEAFERMDKYTLSILLNHHIVRGEFELTELYERKFGIKAAETDYIERLSDDSAGSTYSGTVTASCNCGGTTITVTCETGCGAGCELRNRRRCRYGPSGEEIDCETKEYCVGFCACES